MKIFNPSHPGEILKELWLNELNLTIPVMAKALDVSPKIMTEVIEGRRAVSAEIAYRLSKALKTSPEVWLNLQKTYDLWKAGQESETFLKSVQPLVH